MNSTNQLLKPISAKRNSSNNLEIGGCDTVELAEKYATPLYVIDKKTLKTVCKDYKSAFKNYNKVKMLYASKALCTKAISKIIYNEGFGFDVVSAGEIYTVFKAGVDMSEVLFNGNNKSRDELTLAIKLGVGRISVDNFFEISLLGEIAKSYNKTIDILLRITPGIECHTHEYIQTGHLDSKFGFDMTQIDDAVDMILNDYPNLKLRGLHAHIGSQIFETSIYTDEIEILTQEIKRLDKKFNLNLDEINIGGGLGVKYVETDCPPSIYEIANIIIEKMEECIRKYNIKPPTLYMEPGRSIISPSGVTLYTIGSSKQVPKGKKYVAVDGGMADNARPSLYDAEYIAEIANNTSGRIEEIVTIAGRYCESGDIIIKNITLPRPAEGDVLCVYNTGAYNYSMASNYNRVQKPAMVLVNNSKSDIIIERESLDDLISKDVIPDR